MPCKRIDNNNTLIPYALSQSRRGNYFIGQTPILTGRAGRVIGLLKNPSNSGINIYLNAITLTNRSRNSISGLFYLKSSASGNNSNLVSPSNLAITPEPTPKGVIQYSTNITPPIDGIPVFTRIIQPFSTLIIDGSQIILGPGDSIVVSLREIRNTCEINAIVSFEWWEERTSIC
ncbi:DUF6143 family protein [Clostridium sp. LIBA-8841]|uniref:DUF6143 family protein n=1 Tax=Clostridium sp. LIBA-8841 TaxID=2987530 RepID=UPI002AC47838|nr:DUF6143 family protein [Clostridium sp. LIBA-8841]MDZ5253967.1 DUF6143 family protein [Clostridium sp. LIBA-8841]